MDGPMTCSCCTRAIETGFEHSAGSGNVYCSACFNSSVEQLDEIDRLRARIKDLEAALRPFAKMSVDMTKDNIPLYPIDMMDAESGDRIAWTKDVHHAAEVLLRKTDDTNPGSG